MMLSLPILTLRQQQELHRAILQYISCLAGEKGDQELVAKLALLLDVPVNNYNEEGLISNYLEKKWTTVSRLQRKIIELENEVKHLNGVIDAQNIVPGLAGQTTKKDRTNWIPASVVKTFQTQTQQLIQAVSIHPALPLIFAGCSDGTVIIWNLANDEILVPEKIVKAHTRGVNCISWSRKPINLSNSVNSSDLKNRQFVFATCSADLSIKIWDGGTLNQSRILTGHEHTVSSVAFSQDRPNILYSASRDKTIKVWDLQNGYCIKSFVGHSDWVRDVDAISLRSSLLWDHSKPRVNLGDFLLSCSNDQSIRLSHADSGTGLSLLIGHTHVVECVKFLPLHSNTYIDTYLLENASLFPNMSVEIVNDATYTDTLGYKYCVSGSRDNTVKLWLLPTPTIRPHMHPIPSHINNSQGWLIANLTGHQSWIKSITIHPSGRYILTGGDDKTIRVWDLASLNQSGKIRCIKTLLAHEGFITDIDFSPLSTTNMDEFTQEILKDISDEDRKVKIRKYIQTNTRCLCISGGVDNTVRLWG